VNPESETQKLPCLIRGCRPVDLIQNQALGAELDYAWKWISPGYTRSTNRHRMTTGDPH
jgi:hypothetical protein